ncbi:MAG: AAA family ATPase [Gammaproteobacteria bacterium]|jgi:predicted AAA+ superfamily ATPase
MERLYQNIISWHFDRYQQMVFLAGPRQVGKTTVSKVLNTFNDQFYYLNWDIDKDRALILAGQTKVAHTINLDLLQKRRPIIVFDEIHKYPNWKNFLKGFFDAYHEKIYILVTGSSRLDIFREGGDSLMGRYFVYRMHPITVAECVRTNVIHQEISKPTLIDDQIFKNLLNFGGFPAPFLKKNTQFSNNWKRLRRQQLFREDIRDLTSIQEISQLEILAGLLKDHTGQLLNLSNISQQVGVSINTTKRWLDTLETFYYCFLIRPYNKAVIRSIIKEPKVYLWDWSDVIELGARCENFVAAHLLKATHCWTDLGLGEYGLYFVRDKDKREVDFLITKNNIPWCLVEVKNSKNKSISEHLYRFKLQLNVPHAFQVVFDAEPVDKDCFEIFDPIIVPVQTFLSQLV